MEFIQKNSVFSRLNSLEHNEIRLKRLDFGILAVICLSSLPVWVGLWNLWHSDKNFDGLMLVPCLSVLMIFKSRSEFTSVKPRPLKKILYFLPVTLAAMSVSCINGHVRFAGVFFVMNLLIIVLGTLGPGANRVFLGPLLFLMLMIPPPPFIVDFIVINLQKFFSLSMEILFSSLSDRFIERHGFEFWFTGLDYPMIIAPECSGIRSLMGFAIISSFFAVFDRHVAITAVFILLAGILTALALNFFRILITMQLRLYSLEEYSVGFWHGLLGILVFMIGCVALSKLSRFLKSLNQQNQKEDG